MRKYLDKYQYKDRELFLLLVDFDARGRYSDITSDHAKAYSALKKYPHLTAKKRRLLSMKLCSAL